MTKDDVKEQAEELPETADVPDTADEAAPDPAPEPEAPVSEATPEPAANAEARAAEAEDDTEPATPADPDDPDGEALPVSDEPIEVGSLTFVTVQRITPYGAFVGLADGRSGLIHISEIDRNYVKDVREHLREGDKVEAKVTAIKEDGKIDLSIKALQDPQPRMARGSNPEFEQMLRKFLRGSEERQVDVKRSHMRKRKG